VDTVVELIVSAEFEKWQFKLRDMLAKQRIAARLARIAAGNFGDVKPVGSGVLELRIFYGPGYRVYLTKRRSEVVILLCGGDKSTQQKDIERAKLIALEYEE
jgi:putative addiction module killer protein